MQAKRMIVCCALVLTLMAGALLSPFTMANQQLNAETQPSDKTMGIHTIILGDADDDGFATS